jgi:urea transporter
MARALHLASTGVFALLNLLVGAYGGLVGAAVGSILMLRALGQPPGR